MKVCLCAVHIRFKGKQRQIKMPDRIAHGDSSLLKSYLYFIIRHSKSDGKSHRHLVQNQRIKFYTQKAAKIGFPGSFFQSSQNFATNLL